MHTKMSKIITIKIPDTCMHTSLYQMHPAYQLNIIASAICYELIIMFDVLKLSGTSRVEEKFSFSDNETHE